MLPHELEVQPGIIGQGADDAGDGQIGDRLGKVTDITVQHQRSCDQHQHQDGHPGLLSPVRPEHTDRHGEQAQKQYPADVQAGIAQGTAMKLISIIDPEADMGEQGRGVDRRVDTHQPPRPKKALVRCGHPQKQDQDHGADGIAIDGGQRPRQPFHFALRQPIFKIILHHQAEQRQEDELHGPFEIRADVPVDPNDEGHKNQQRESRDEAQGLQIMSFYQHAQPRGAHRICHHGHDLPSPLVLLSSRRQPPSGRELN